MVAWTSKSAEIETTNNLELQNHNLKKALKIFFVKKFNYLKNQVHNDKKNQSTEIHFIT